MKNLLLALIIAASSNLCSEERSGFSFYSMNLKHTQKDDLQTLIEKLPSSSDGLFLYHIPSRDLLFHLKEHLSGSFPSVYAFEEAPWIGHALIASRYRLDDIFCETEGSIRCRLKCDGHSLNLRFSKDRVSLSKDDESNMIQYQKSFHLAGKFPAHRFTFFDEASMLAKKVEK